MNIIFIVLQAVVAVKLLFTIILTYFNIMDLTVFITKNNYEEGLAYVFQIYNCNSFFLQDVKSHCLAFVRTIKSVSLSDTTRAAHFLDIGKTMN